MTKSNTSRRTNKSQKPDAHAAKQFYVAKDREGKNPTVRNKVKVTLAAGSLTAIHRYAQTNHLESVPTLDRE